MKFNKNWKSQIFMLGSNLETKNGNIVNTCTSWWNGSSTIARKRAMELFYKVATSIGIGNCFGMKIKQCRFFKCYALTLMAFKQISKTYHHWGYRVFIKRMQPWSINYYNKYP